eukprot:GHVO01034092.1.p2 GENE.GHVO01034092.1~~GHVO01034092.1.p2  ORF type:complete len:320 (-),score=45.01 GHVO01034092.1:980-1849(-)
MQKPGFGTSIGFASFRGDLTTEASGHLRNLFKRFNIHSQNVVSDLEKSKRPYILDTADRNGIKKSPLRVSPFARERRSETILREETRIGDLEAKPTIPFCQMKEPHLPPVSATSITGMELEEGAFENLLEQIEAAQAGPQVVSPDLAKMLFIINTKILQKESRFQHEEKLLQALNDKFLQEELEKVSIVQAKTKEVLKHFWSFANSADVKSRTEQDFIEKAIHSCLDEINEEIEKGSSSESPQLTAFGTNESATTSALGGRRAFYQPLINSLEVASKHYESALSGHKQG